MEALPNKHKVWLFITQIHGESACRESPYLSQVTRNRQSPKNKLALYIHRYT